MSYQIDVLMAVFNGEKYIEEQITSILNQTYQNLHLIIRDNASEDSTVNIIERLIEGNPDRITLLCSLKNVGVIGNFSALMEQSHADYVMFSDADDVWQLDKVEKTVAELNELEKKFGKDNPLLVHTDLTVVNGQLKPLHPSFWKYSHIKPQKGDALNRLLVQNVVTGCTMLVNRPLLNLALPIPESIVMHDWWLALIASAFGHIGTVDEPTMLYRQHGSNDTGAKKFSIVSSLKRHLNKKEQQKISLSKPKRFKQAQELLQRYKKLLSQEQITLLTDFVLMEKASFLKKRYLMTKHKFLKHGFARNVVSFLPFDSLKKLIST
jgi:glycosyltransferase involved in cell wall biosynthesis